MPIIQVQNLSKRYLIRHESAPYATLRDRLAHPIKAIRNKMKNQSEEFLALNNISFEVERGQVIGVIGPNGSGKSTLLKVLSQITPPSGGQAIIKGRATSLLEIGTGFHPELSGRENIYLSGVILGMTRSEIHKKFDEIVSFSGVNKFLDTPVKYYSSGMGVRLGFAVAAHLDSDILIIDEVLAVGDSEFQKKCLNKMNNLTKDQGRTILFVSHDMKAVASLCERGIYLKNGSIVKTGDVKTAIDAYLCGGFVKINNPVDREIVVKTEPSIVSIKMCNGLGNLESNFSADDVIHLQLQIKCIHPAKFHVSWYMKDVYGRQIAVGASYPMDDIVYSEKDKIINCKIEPKSLVPGKYIIGFFLYLHNMVIYDNWDDAVVFNITTNIINNKFNYPGPWDATQYIKHQWSK